MSDTSNPLAEALPNSLDELMSRPSIDLIREDEARGEPRNIMTIVSALRVERERWRIAEAAGAVKAPKPAKAGGKPAASLADLGLDDGQ